MEISVTKSFHFGWTNTTPGRFHGMSRLFQLRWGVRNGAARAAHHLQDASAVTAELPGGEHEAVRVVVLGNGAL